MSCPICGSPIKNMYRDSINMGLCESFEQCQNCYMYAEQFAYGGYEIVIGDFTVHYSHNTPEAQKREIDEASKMLFDYYKKLWDIKLSNTYKIRFSLRRLYERFGKGFNLG
jgi:hypothetical protein